MNTEKPTPQLSQIVTSWSVVRQAHGGSADTVTKAMQELLRRYGRAIQRYLLGATRNPEAADDLYQEFALRLLRGTLRNADPHRGRFRDYVKGALRHLIADHFRRRGVQFRPLPEDGRELAAPVDEDAQFDHSWRDELLNQTWKALERLQEESGSPFHTVLRFRAEHPEMRSAAMAEELSASLDRRVSADWVRQTVHRARARFADLLLHEVADSLEDPTSGQLEEELAELGLLEYCEPALKCFQGGG